MRLLSLDYKVQQSLQVAQLLGRTRVYKEGNVFPSWYTDLPNPLEKILEEKLIKKL